MNVYLFCRNIWPFFFHAIFRSWVDSYFTLMIAVIFLTICILPFIQSISWFVMFLFVYDSTQCGTTAEFQNLFCLSFIHLLSIYSLFSICLILCQEDVIQTLDLLSRNERNRSVHIYYNYKTVYSIHSKAQAQRTLGHYRQGDLWSPLCSVNKH